MKMKRMWIKTGVVLLGAGCWFLALLFYGKMGKQAGYFNAYYDMPVLTRNALSAFMEQTEQPEALPQMTGWSIEEKQSVSSEIRGNITADVWKIAGSVESFFAGQLAGGSYPWEEDEQGCMVSTALAEKLFGTKNVQGNQITIAGSDYFIRGCIESSERFAAVRAEDEEGLEGLFLKYKEKSEPASSAQNLLMRMTGKEPDGFLEGNLYSALARVVVSLPIWILFFVYMRKGYSQLNRITGFGLRLSVKLLATGVIGGMVTIGLMWTLRFSGDYLPVMWSDVGFFPKLVAEKQEIFRELQQRLLCPGDAKLFSDLKNTVLFAGISILAEVMIASVGKTHMFLIQENNKES